MTAAGVRTGRIRRAFHRLPVCSLFVWFVNSNGDPSILCYRMGVDLFSAGRARFAPAVPLTAVRSNLAFVVDFARRTRNHRYSTVANPFSTPQD
jgi:hypothetical protein